MPASLFNPSAASATPTTGRLSPAVNEWAEPWWINPRVPQSELVQSRRPAREFTAMAGQICLVAWMLGLLAQSACAERGWPPEVAAAWEDAAHVWTPAASAADAASAHGEITEITAP
jgi:hypothetical protein